MRKKHTLFIKGTTCEDCIKTIHEAALNPYRKKHPQDTLIIQFNRQTETTTLNITVSDAKENENILERIETEILNKINSVGYVCILQPQELPANNREGDEKQEVVPGDFHREMPVQQYFRYWQAYKYYLAGIAGVGMCLFTMLPPSIFPEAWTIGIMTAMPIAEYISCGLVVLIGLDTYWFAVKLFWRTGLFKMEGLLTVTTLTAVVLSLLSLQWPQLGCPMLSHVGLMIFFFREVGMVIRRKTERSIQSNLPSPEYVKLRDLAPQKVERVLSYQDEKYEALLAERQKSLTPDQAFFQGPFQKIRIDQLQPKDIFVLRAQEAQLQDRTFPTSGICLTPALIQRTILTGENTAVQAQPHQELTAGTTVAKHSPYDALIQVTQNTEDSFAQLEQNDSDSKKEPIALVNRTDSVIKYYPVVTIFLSTGVGLAIGFFYHSTIAGMQEALAGIMAGCPCIIAMIIPLTTTIAISQAQEQGILFRNEQALLTSSQIKMLILDLRGTLTRGQPKVETFHLVTQRDNIDSDSKDQKLSMDSNINQKDKAFYLHCAYLLEKQSDHPFAHAFCEYVENQERKKSHTALSESTELSALTPIKVDSFGISGQIAENKSLFIHYAIGNQAFMQQQGVKDINQIKEAQVAEGQGKPVIYLAREQKPVAYAILQQDPLRSDARLALKTLSSLGILSKICSGTDAPVAKQYGEDLLIHSDDIKTECLPQQKAQWLTQYQTSKNQNEQSVGNLGDGINDLPIARKSGLSMALQSEQALGNKILQAYSNVVVTDKNPHSQLIRMVLALKIGKTVEREIYTNISLSLACTITSILLPPLLEYFDWVTLDTGIQAAVVMTLPSIIVALRLIWFKQRTLPAVIQATLFSNLPIKTPPTPTEYSLLPAAYLGT